MEDSGIGSAGDLTLSMEADSPEHIVESRNGEDSDEEEEEEEVLVVKKNRILNRPLIDSDDENDEVRSFVTPVESTSSVNDNHLVNRGVSSSHFIPDDDSNHSPALKENSSDSDSDSPDERSGSDHTPVGTGVFNDEDGIPLDAIKSKYKAKKMSKSSKAKAPSRKSKLAALEEIHSETQRIVRESRVALPYHVPKQRTLADFLKRRTSFPAVPLKTHVDEMDHIWEKIEEYEKTAESFYKSESDNEVEPSNSSNKPDIQNVRDEVGGNFQNSRDDLQKADSHKNDNIEFPNRKLSDSEVYNTEEFPSLQLSEILKDSEVTLVRDDNDGHKLEENFNEQHLENNSPACSPSEFEANQTYDTTVPITPANETELELSDHDNTIKTKTLPESVGNSSNNTLNKVPKISGGPDDIIDLESIPSKAATGLMKRFIKHINLKPKVTVEQNVEMSIVTSEYNIEGEIIKLNSETLHGKTGDVPKPGEKLTSLKASLKQQITLAREQLLAKKIEEYKLYEEELCPEDKDLDDQEEDFNEIYNKCSEKEDDDKIEDEKEDDYEEEKDEDTEEEEVEEDNNDREYHTNMIFADDEADESDVDEDDEKEDVDEDTNDLLGDNSEVESEPPEKEFSDEEPAIPSVPISNIISGLLEESQSNDVSASQLIDFCSGKFTCSELKLEDLEKLDQKRSAFVDEVSDSKDTEYNIPDMTEETNTENVDSDDDIVPSKTKKKKQIEYSDDEDDAQGTTSNYNEDALSDNDTPSTRDELQEDEEDQSDDEADQIANEKELLDEEDELAKNLAKGFMEGEAELSGSDWDSADEDEKDLDLLEREEGDQEKFSQRKLQRELGKIHMREMLADDKREIRLLQEILLEDGELHSDGPKRQRLYRWYNQDENGVFHKTGLEDEAGGEGLDEEEEEVWRRERLQREIYLKNNKIDYLSVDDSAIFTPTEIKKTIPNINKAPAQGQGSSTLLKSPDPKLQFSLTSKRGSFLSRGDKMLSKLAEITNNVSENPLNSRGRRNMVFAVVSPPKKEDNEPKQAKRKGDELKSAVKKKLHLSSSETPQNSFLDKLRLSESIS